jgi:Family of unknown function (DUF6152)
MSTKSTCLMLLTVLMVIPSSPQAHHSSAAFYLTSASITITGTVTEFRFINPHARAYLRVVDEKGNSVVWMAEGAAGGALRRRGWVGNELKPGDRITVTGAPSRDGSPSVEWRVIILADGRKIGGGNGFPYEREELLRNLEQQRRNQTPTDKK